MANPSKIAKEAIITEEFKAYTVKWKCQKGHTNFKTIIGLGRVEHDVCLKCAEHYDFIPKISDSVVVKKLDF